MQRQLGYLMILALGAMTSQLGASISLNLPMHQQLTK